jgi:hypothetical protein
MTVCDSRTFFKCHSLQSISIPSFVDSIDGSAFARWNLSEIFVDAENHYFRLCGKFLMIFDGTSLIPCFGHDCYVKISPEVEIVSGGSSSWCAAIRGFEFEPESRVRRLGVRTFEHCAQLESICIPASTELLGESSFWKCNNLQEFRIEGGARLRRIEAIDSLLARPCRRSFFQGQSTVEKNWIWPAFGVVLKSSGLTEKFSRRRL